MKNKLKRISLGLVVFALIVTFTLWLMPTGAVFGEGEGEPPADPPASDTSPPVITLLGDNPVSVDKDAAYEDAGATAEDDVDGDITDAIVVDNPVDTSVPGSYEVAYNVIDAAGNAADTVTRTVEVVEPPDDPDDTDTSDTGSDQASDTSPPVITLLGDNPVSVDQNAVYEDAGATAVDDIDGDITDSIEVINPVDVSVPGSYSVIYNVSDVAGNEAEEVIRTVNVVDPSIEEDPEIILGPAISTDKADYAPDETVLMTGTGFAPNTTYVIEVVRPDGSIVLGNGTFIEGSDSVLSDASGNFTYNYILNGVVGTYNVRVVGDDGLEVATTFFTDCPWNGIVYVSKCVKDCKGNDTSDNEWFKVRLWKGSSSNNINTYVGSRWIQDGDTVSWHNLETEKYYKVTEDNESDHILKYITAPQYLYAGDDDSFYVENWQKPKGKVVVYKDVVNYNDTDNSFTVRLRVNVPNDKRGWYTWDEKWLKDGESVEFCGLPDGTEYRVYEICKPDCYEHIDTVYNDPIDKKIEGCHDTDTVTVKNKAWGKVVVCKDVVNYDGSNDTFRVRLKVDIPGDGQGLYNYDCEWLEDDECYTWWLPVGTYYEVEEIDMSNPCCYKLDYIDYEDSDQRIEWPCDDDTVTVKNKAYGKIIICKDIIGSETDTTEFDVELYTKRPGDCGYSPEGTAKVSEGSCVTFSDIPVGTYYYAEEVNVPEGYVLDSYVYQDGDQKIEWPCDDDTITVKNRELGSIEIFKTDATSGDPLGGSTIQVFKEGSWNLVDEVVLGADGYYLWENLEWGNYKIVEAIAPEGYEKFPDVFLTIGEEQRHFVYEAEIADPRILGRINIAKVDDAGEPIPFEAGFTIFEDDGVTEYRAEKFVDAAGLYTFDNIEWGDYIVRETTVPDGYVGAADIDITIGPGNVEETIKLTFENTPPPETTTTTEVAGLQVAGLAFTGVHPVFPIAGITTIVSGLGLFITSLVRRRRK